MNNSEIQRNLIAKINVNPSQDDEPDGCVLIYEMNDEINLVTTSRSNGDCELFFSKAMAKEIGEELIKASDA